MQCEGGSLVKRASYVLVVLLLVAAACGGGDAEPAATSTAAPAGGGGTATTVAPTTTVAAPAGNPSDDFCEFIVGYSEDADFNPIGLNPEELENLFTTNVDAINEAVQLAPSEIKTDVEMFADAYSGFVGLLAEYDFNFLALSDAALDDPRMTALDDPELQAAGDRIEAYCGIDNFISTAPEPPDSGTGGGGSDGGVSAGTDLPDDFPSELVPPGGVVVATVNVAGASSVTFDVEGDTDDIIGYYTDIVGAPVQETSTPKGALWFTTYEGGSLTLVVAEVGSDMVQVNVTRG